MDEEVKEVKGAQGAPAQSKHKAKFTVLSPFVDKDNYSKTYAEGDDVSHFTADRLEDCVNRGLVKKG